MKQGNKKEKYIQYLLLGICILYGFLLVYLFYNQTLFVEGGAFESDTPYHISMAVEDGWYYSFTAYIYLFFSLFSAANELTAVFLSAVTVATIYGTYLLLKECLWQRQVTLPASQLMGAAMALNFVMAFYIKAASRLHYIGYQSASIWHNSTYICMKCAAVFALWQFMKIYRTYEKDLTLGRWLGFAGLLLIATGVKPSFLMVFAPVMACMLLVDWLRYKKPFFKVFLFGCTVIPSLLVILWQNLVLFGEDTGNGFVIQPFYTLFMHSDNPKVTILLSLVFPGVIFVFHWKDFFKDRIFSGGVLIWLLGFIEVALFTESGKRARDANFMWGYSFSIFVFFCIGLIKLIEDYKNREYLGGRPFLRKAYLVSATAIFAYHVVCGLWFFGILLTGASYWS